MIDQLYQLGISILAIALLAWLAKIYWPQKWILNSDRVMQAFERSDYNMLPEEIWFDQSGNAAIATMNDSTAIGYALAFGDRVMCRPLRRGYIKSIKATGRSLNIRFADFTLETNTVSFDDEDTCKKVKNVMSSIMDSTDD